MKKILLTAMMLPLALGAMAQKLDLGIGGGVTNNIRPSFSKSGDKSKVNPLLYAQASLKLLGFQFGLRGEYTRFVYQGDVTNYPGITTPNGGAYADLVVGDRVMNIRAFANKTFAISRIEPYLGINVGYSSTGGGNGSVNLVGQSDDNSGFTAGAQAGLSVFVTKHIGVNAQLGFDYYSLNPEDDKFASGHLLSPSLTVGVRYRLP